MYCPICDHLPREGKCQNPDCVIYGKHIVSTQPKGGYHEPQPTDDFLPNPNGNRIEQAMFWRDMLNIFDRIATALEKLGTRV